MGKIFFVLGKSCSGKDSVVREILRDKELNLSPMTMYTTRPRRSNEVDGVHYKFIDTDRMSDMIQSCKIISQENYKVKPDTWWKYCLFDEGYTERLDNGENFVFIGNPYSCLRFIKHFPRFTVCPIYIDCRDDVIIKRAVKRQMEQEEPNYVEMCRRFLADDVDYRRDEYQVVFDNSVDFGSCVSQVKEYIRKNICVI